MHHLKSIRGKLSIEHPSSPRPTLRSCKQCYKIQHGCLSSNGLRSRPDRTSWFFTYATYRNWNISTEKKAKFLTNGDGQTATTGPVLTVLNLVHWVNRWGRIGFKICWDTLLLFSWEKNPKPTIPFAWVIPALHTLPNSAVKNEVTTIIQGCLKNTVICYYLSER